MALVFWEGFDPYNNLNDLKSVKGNVQNGSWWDRDQPTGAYPDIGLSTTGGRFNLGKLYGPYPYSDGWGIIGFSSNLTEFYTGRAIYISSGYDQGQLCVWSDTYNYGMARAQAAIPDVWIDSNGGNLRVLRRTSATTGGDARNSAKNSTGNWVVIGTWSGFKYNTWNWIEARVKMSSSNVNNDGIVQVWINNQLVVSNTATITKSANTMAAYSGINFGCPLNTDSGYYSTWAVDDVYICDTTGSAPWNTRLGDLRIKTVVPVGDVSPNTGTPSTGTTHWGVVDELPANTTDYVIVPINASQNMEAFVKANTVPVNSTIIAVGVNYYAQKSDAGAGNIRSIIVNNSSGYVANGSNVGLSTSFSYGLDTYSTDPATSAQWTYANVANLLVGVVVGT